jgi:hypothetical protein
VLIPFYITGTAGNTLNYTVCSIWNSNYWWSGTVNVTVTAVTANL